MKHIVYFTSISFFILGMDLASEPRLLRPSQQAGRCPGLRILVMHNSTHAELVAVGSGNPLYFFVYFTTIPRYRG